MADDTIRSSFVSAKLSRMVSSHESINTLRLIFSAETIGKFSVKNKAE